MQVEFLNKFSKDVDGIHIKSVKKNIARLIVQIESANDLHSIPNLKKTRRS